MIVGRGVEELFALDSAAFKESSKGTISALPFLQDVLQAHDLFLKTRSTLAVAACGTAHTIRTVWQAGGKRDGDRRIRSGKKEQDYCSRDCLKKRVCAIWLKTAPVRATWRIVQSQCHAILWGNLLASSGEVPPRPRALKRRRFPELSLVFLAGFLLGVPKVKGSKDPLLSGDSEVARP